MEAQVNRPYASTDVSANLKNKVPKAAAQKVLTNLADKGILTIKMYGKQSVFVYAQHLLPVLDHKQLSALEEDLRVSQDDLEEKRKDLKSLQADLATKGKQAKTEDLGGKIEHLKADNKTTIRSLIPFRGTDDDGSPIIPLSAEETKKIDDDFIQWRKEWTNRKKVCKDLMGALQDAYQVQDQCTCEEEQGISPEDDEAKAIEAGEFCRPGIKLSPRPNPVREVDPMKRSEIGNPEESAPKRKKAKRV
ncbi:MAG: hypothetical protein TREMPRED_003645 [Tremellales sp. Tagirdzhanova-0007]|nr:MAG: hypothetical protein TREMPRED_003645 [Tremellales sp. Tagirdzhanova-0007]